ncbi:MAG: 60 kDa chaperonin [Candidatus Jorgensenbacteria bacterium GW2011_GWA2_45_13]|uniref:60 kDa chaperonin n=1 Tax=Candidatus Jorgensenbacteria bacterium GW2011_GWA2_45_13 TaxID=1618662 RepID=A0A0G1L4H1_9BACT|nr:MAG: 60 kDa chaperonin [Candidatus Jorgensenbacteria bacterium GW2011_GWA2_45_13]
MPIVADICQLNIMSKQIKFNEDARMALKKGIDTLAEAVKMTLGPRGRAVVIDKGYGSPQVTFDGVTVAKEIELEGKYENLGAEFIKQAADKTNDNVGDGTTTSVVLAHALIEEGEKVIREKGFNVIQLAEELKKGSEDIIKNLESQREEINDNKKIQEVATLSAKDKEIGKLIAEVMGKIGKEGVVTIEDSNTIGNAYEMVEGMQFDRGYVSQYMVTNQDRMEAVLEDPYVLVTDKKIGAISELLPLLEKIVQSGKKELLIVAEEIEGEALATLVLNKLRGVFNVLAVKAPGFGDRKKEMMQDIAIVTGAEFIADDLGKKLENVDVESLGHAHKVVANKDTTTIVDGKGEKKAIADRVAQESAQKELKQRVEDAVAATRAAMEEGIVPGGGIALFNVYQALRGKQSGDEVAKAAFGILEAALKAPIIAIIENSGETPKTVLDELSTKKAGGNSAWLGFNASQNKLGDLKEVGIVDPLKVTKTAFRNAISVAANYLTIGAAIADIPEKKDKETGGGMPGGMDIGY